MTVTEDVLHRTDFLRGSRRILGDTGPYKEWHHFVVHSERFRLIINFSLTDPTNAPDTEPVPRVIALVRHDDYVGTVEAFDPSECELRTGRVAARLGPCALALVEGAYELTVDLPAIRLRGSVRLVPVSTPFVVNNQPLAPGSRLSWLFVPRLEGHGHVWVGDTRVSLRGRARVPRPQLGSLPVGRRLRLGVGVRASRAFDRSVDDRVHVHDRPIPPARHPAGPLCLARA